MKTLCCVSLFLFYFCQYVSCDEVMPEVTLSHGGILTGKRISFQDVPVDLFLGIRYAQPPVDSLRFKRPEPYPSWEGKVDATTVGSRCAQMEQNNVIGVEDCLFMDITVPGGVTPGAKKAVMVWIHGGGYMFGTGSTFLGTPLAVTGDVIYVSFNYRVAILGFLADGPGTGNFGLWDQRAALVWIKENIEQFGGDPELVTIFGESAGAGSVSSQVMGQHNDGLFKRAIQQSGTLYQMLPTSTNRWVNLGKTIRQQANCTSAGKVYDCVSHMTAAQLLTQIQLSPWESFWHPFSDYDFFDSDVDQYSYKSSQRFDLLLGINGQEGGIMLALDTAIYAMITGRSIENGMDMAFVREYLTFACPHWFAPYSPQLCADFVINNYKLDEALDDKDRVLRLRDFLGQVFFDADAINALSQHSSGETATYGYYFTEPTKETNSLWQVPEWAKSMADHADDLTFVFGGAFYKDIKDPTWEDTVKVDPFIHSLIVGAAKEENKPLSKTMMTMWTNFAKTGNPNEPVPLPEGTPVWPQFNTETNQLLEINSNDIKVIETPNKEMLEKIQSHIYSARQLQFAADRPPPEDEIKWLKAREELGSNAEAKRHDEL